MTRQFRAAIVAVAPTVLLVGFVYHPYVANGTDESALAEAAASNTTRWGLAHLAIGVGYALITLPFISLLNSRDRLPHPESNHYWEVQMLENSTVLRRVCG